MNYIKLILLIILLIPTISQAEFYHIYTGTIGQNKAEFYFADNHAFYFAGKEHQVKHLSFIRERERNDKFNFNVYYADSFEKILDKIYIENFNDYVFGSEESSHQHLNGYTLNGDKVNLHKIFEYEKHSEQHPLSEAEFNNIEFLQEHSTKDFYFKVLISKKKKEEVEIVGINIYSKHDGRLIQTITGIQGCKFNSYVSIMTHEAFDFNFDGDNNDFYLTKNRNYGPNQIDDYYVYDKTQQQFVKLNLDGNDFRFDDEEKEATSYKTCPGKKENDEISLIDDFKYIGNNRYKRVKTECLYKSGEYLNEENNQFEYKNQRACKPKEIKDCRNYIDTNDYDDY
ncbi:hypothetical protein [Gilliamella intestini]|uniref:Uncharacterized protein n=1 Tax=Gilliamella intestini TaxID=1798183 RepID=A0A1C4D055_9GAMM|nr:hypothetical protein [Gilliamella intestini]SCC24660.1 hypothetical protein GA0061080_10555 [Gilliamella intestini]